MTQDEWVKLIAFGFCHGRAPFAFHQQDRKCARVYLKKAREAKLTLTDVMEHARLYLSQLRGPAVDEACQLEYVRKYFMGKLSS
ncbi:hypothetical protein ACTU44_05525 [Thalassospira sp. SM2505]